MNQFSVVGLPIQEKRLDQKVCTLSTGNCCSLDDLFPCLPTRKRANTNFIGIRRIEPIQPIISSRKSLNHHCLWIAYHFYGIVISAAQERGKFIGSVDEGGREIKSCISQNGFLHISLSRSRRLRRKQRILHQRPCLVIRNSVRSLLRQAFRLKKLFCQLWLRPIPQPGLTRTSLIHPEALASLAKR